MSDWITAHVMPRGDLIDHQADEDCPCGPTAVPVPNPDGSMGWNVIHHSLDGRELVEEGRRLASRRDDLIAAGVDPDLLEVPLSPSGVNGEADSSRQGADDAPTEPKGDAAPTAHPAPLGSCYCGSPEAFALTPGEVITHGPDVCVIGPALPKGGAQ